MAAAGPDDYFASYFRGCAFLAAGDRLGALHAFQRAFTDYFYDSYHYVLLPTWEKMVERVRGDGGNEGGKKRNDGPRITH